MGFKKINAPSIKELFLSQIKEMILSGELKPGDRLPPERELADTLGISKTIVHEGIRDLSRMGFLDVASRKGVYVADYTTTGNLDTLFAMIEYRGAMPDAKIITSLLDLRLYLECPALELVAANHTPEDMALLDNALAAANAARVGSNEDMARALFVFRRTIVSLSGNCISPLIMNAFFTASIQAWVLYCSFYGNDRVYEDLRATTEWIREGNGAAAVSAFQDSITDYKKSRW